MLARAIEVKVMEELPNPVNFAAATETVTADHMAEMIPCGPDPERHVEGIFQYAEAGFENIAVVQVGDDQKGWKCSWGRGPSPPITGSAWSPRAPSWRTASSTSNSSAGTT